MVEREKAGRVDGVDSAAEGMRKGRHREVDWNDPSIPVGNAPPMARWPLALAGAAWLAGIAFLIAMTVSRFRADGF